MKVALDVEGVLSNTHEVAYERGENLDHSMLREWHFPTDDHYDEFMHVSQNLWHNHTHLVPPMEEPRVIRNATRSIGGTHDLDVVTHRHNVDTQLKHWLSAYHVTYEDFRAPSKEKDELAYDVYVDDKPALARRIKESETRVILLRDRPYNRDIEECDRVRRISSLSEAAELLVGEDTRKEIERLTRPVNIRERVNEHIEENKAAYVAMGKA